MPPLPPRYWEPPLDRPKLAAVGALFALLVLVTLVRSCSGAGAPRAAKPPSVATPAAASVAAGAPITISGQAAAGETIRLLDNDRPVADAQVTADPEGKWTLGAPKGLPEGAHRLAVSAEGVTGGPAASTPFTLTVASATPIPSATPTVPTFAVNGTAVPWIDLSNPETVQWPAVAAELKPGHMPTLRGTATAGADIRFWEGTTPVGATQADAKGRWSFPLPDLAAGAHKLRVIVGGGRGQGLQSGEWTITVAGATATPTVTPTASATPTPGKGTPGKGTPTAKTTG